MPGTWRNRVASRRRWPCITYRGLAKDFVKVLISGEGGDEAFAGYQTYRGVLWLERLKSVLGPLNGPLSAGFSAIDRVVGSHRLAKYGPLMNLDFEDYYYSRTSTPFAYFNSHTRELYSKDFLSRCDTKIFRLASVKRLLDNGDGNGKVNKMLYVDTKTSLPDDLLLKADKMTMANSIELRVPLLDHKLLEFAAALPENFKVRGFTTKYIVKRALRKRVPKEILHRKKAGFPVPYASWLRTELKDWTLGTPDRPGNIVSGLFQSRLYRAPYQARRANRTIPERDPFAGVARIVASSVFEQRDCVCSLVR